MSNSLVIVESPAKARTIKKFLGDDYTVESSVGHVRDLPDKVSQLPAAHRKKPWAKLAVDVDNDFRPIYIVPSGRKEKIRELKKLVAEADELLLATDEDREGESIAWHLVEALKPAKTLPVKRMVFHEITRQAIEEAVASPREIDKDLVEAQEARRILDRLYGFEVSEVLWKKIKGGLSAGRVQSVALRLIVDRERERRAFRSAGFWSIQGSFTDGAESREFDARLVEVDGTRLARSGDFDSQGELKKPGLRVLDQATATALESELGDCSYRVAAVERKPWRRRPAAPFITSTLQQEAGRKLRYSASRTMRLAQGLYESGYITYMRTDSVTLSTAALAAARSEITSRYGEQFLPDTPRIYKKKVKNAQEAHEAIRPAGDDFRSPEEVAHQVDPAAAKLYELIWKRTIASQMKDAVGQSVRVTVTTERPAGGSATLQASGLTITFPGFLEVYSEGSDDSREEADQKERRLPPLEEGDVVEAQRFAAKRHETQPPPRYTEASLVRKLEELGVGRPSTYASIIETIQKRYVWRKGGALIPSYTAIAVIKLLENHFAELVDYAFTAWMEDELDAISNGTESSTPFLSRFYFGDQTETSDSAAGLDRGLHALVSEHLDEIDAREVNTLLVGEDRDGAPIAVRIGRYGPYIQRGDERASLPDDLPPDELSVEKAEELFAQKKAAAEHQDLGSLDGQPVTLREGRYGPYVQLGEAEGKSKPKRASLFKSMTVGSVTLEDAIQLLSLPREVGVDDDGIPIIATNGRYGPYVGKQREFRSLESEGQIFTITLEEAKALLAAPKQRRGQKVLREVGTDPVSQKPVTLKEGRFGPYVTDGEVNASLRKADDPETLTLERASELLQMRRERGPVKRRRRTSKKKK